MGAEAADSESGYANSKASRHSADARRRRQLKNTKIFEPAEYKTDPKIETITGGGTANIVIPFSFDEGRPTSYKVKVLED